MALSYSKIGSTFFAEQVQFDVGITLYAFPDLGLTEKVDIAQLMARKHRVQLYCW